MRFWSIWLAMMTMAIGMEFDFDYRQAIEGQTSSTTTPATTTTQATTTSTTPSAPTTTPAPNTSITPSAPNTSTTTPATTTTTTTLQTTTTQQTTSKVSESFEGCSEELNKILAILHTIKAAIHHSTTQTTTTTTTTTLPPTLIPTMFSESDEEFDNFPSLPDFPIEITAVVEATTTQTAFDSIKNWFRSTNQEILMATTIPSLIVFVMLLVVICGYCFYKKRSTVQNENVEVILI